MTRKFIVQICKQIVEKKVKDIKIALSSERYRRTEEHRHLVYHSSAPLREFPKKNGVAYASAADAVQTAAIDRVHKFTVTGFAMENDVGAPRRDLWILPARFALSADIIP